MNAIRCILVLCIASTSFLVVSGDSCTDNGANCAFMTSLCSIELFAKYYCRKTCGKCDAIPPPTKAPTQPPVKPSDPPVKGVCGNRQPDTGRVIAGLNAPKYGWPWQVLLVNKGYPSCGGTIIDPLWIVTAAHCVDRVYSTQDIFIRTGEHDMRVNDYTEKDYKVAKIRIHESWDTKTLQNDLALIKLEKPITYTRSAMPACLPDKEVPVGTKCYITGWGKIEHPGQMHSRLQQAEMPVVSTAACDRYNYPYTRIRITKGMVCAGHGGTTNVSGCHGDSGGPFVCKINGRWEIHGAVSHGSGDCDADKTYSVFTRITEYRDWIDNKMKNN